MNHWAIYHDTIPDCVRACLDAPVVSRLRDVGMNCGCEYAGFPRFRGLAPYSRFEHSLGAALIAWRFTADPAQAVAALLHDVATPVFAHVVDFLKGDYLAQEATEAGTAEMIAGCAALREALEGLGLAVDDVSDYHRYPIADNDSPRLSADRLEYTVGNSLNYGVCTPEEARRIYGDLAVDVNEEGQPELAFRHADAAGAFARAALACSKIYVSDEDRYAMQMLAEVLGRAIEWGVLGEADLYATEPVVIGKLRSDGRTAALWHGFRAYASIERAEAPGDGEGWRRIYAKKRCIDPLVIGKGRASALFPGFAEALDAFRAESQDYWVRGVM